MLVEDFDTDEVCSLFTIDQMMELIVLQIASKKGLIVFICKIVSELS